MKNFERFMEHLTKLISYKTVKADPVGDAPFGEENKKCLNYFLDIAKNMGFKTINYDNYGGEIIFGEGKEIGIIGHLDVVPEGEGWNTPPYTLTKVGDDYFGRGTGDDKAPILMCLYALKELKDSGINPNVKFRLFVGCNEETGWEDYAYMKTKTTFPEYGFSPDGNFPLTYAEKGMYRLTFKLNPLKNFSEFSGGTVINAVCAKASCKATEQGINKQLLKKYNLTLDENMVITSIGKTAHSAHPELGENALNNLFEYILEMGEDVRALVDYLLNDKSSIRKLQNEQGNLTLSANLIESDNLGITIKADMRVPAPLSFEEIKRYLDSFGLNYHITEKHPPFMNEKDGWFANSLINAYIQVTGDKKATPKAMCGSSFARVFEKGYAFGADELYGLQAHMHEENERVNIKAILDGYEIYKRAIINLAKAL